MCVCYLSPSHGYGCCWMCSALLLRISRHTTVTICLHTMVCTTVNTITFDIILFTVLCMHHLQFSLTEGRCCADNINNYVMNYETAMTTAHIHTFTKQENWLFSSHFLIKIGQELTVPMHKHMYSCSLNNLHLIISCTYEIAKTNYHRFVSFSFHQKYEFIASCVCVSAYVTPFVPIRTQFSSIQLSIDWNGEH